MRTMPALMILALTLFLATSTLVTAAEPTVLRVVVVKTDDVNAYVQQIEQGKAILKRLGAAGTIRAWRARFAGPDTGTVVVSVEYSNMAAFASDEPKIAGSAEYQAWLKGLDKVRTIVSDSLYMEL